MAKIARFTQIVFGGSGPAGDFAVFGSQAAGSPVTTNNVATIQSLPAWVQGWQAAVTAGQAPYLEDMNGAMLVAFTQLAYMLQQGIPEWDPQTTYYTGSFVTRPGTVELYSSAVDNNLGNGLPAQISNANWFFVGYMGGGSLVPVGTIIDFGGANVPGGYLLCNGVAVSRTTYSVLFNAIGTTWGAGDGTTTFNVPPPRMVTVGTGGAGTGVLGNTLGSVGGEETHTLVIGEMPSHGHTVSDPGHSHSLNYGGGAGTPYVAGVNNLGTSASGGVNPNTTGITIANNGGGGAHNNVQPSMVVNKCIKY